MEFAQKQKYRPMEQDRNPRNKPMHLWVPFFFFPFILISWRLVTLNIVVVFVILLTEEARIYNGAKTASSINGAGKTGQLNVKELNQNNS